MMRYPPSIHFKFHPSKRISMRTSFTTKKQLSMKMILFTGGREIILHRNHHYVLLCFKVVTFSPTFLSLLFVKVGTYLTACPEHLVNSKIIILLCGQPLNNNTLFSLLEDEPVTDLAILSAYNQQYHVFSVPNYRASARQCESVIPFVVNKLTLQNGYALRKSRWWWWGVLFPLNFLPLRFQLSVILM